MKNIFVELFRFDKKTDYLPYYKKYNLKIDEDITINELLELINSKEEFGFEQGCNLRINNIFLNSNEILKDVLKKLGDELKIEPISIYRSMKDLIIDNSDFVQKANILADFLSQEQVDKALSSYELDYYASNSINFNRDYIGEHVLYLACDLIKEKPQLKAEVLDILDDSESGIYFHTSLKNRVFRFDQEKEDQICELLSMMPKVKSFENKIIDSNEVDLSTSAFDGFNIAIYEGGLDLGLKALVEKSGATLVKLDSIDSQIPYGALSVDEKFALRIAGEVLLEAKDSSVDFILVNDQNSFDTFDNKQKLIEKYVGREIELPIITKSEFITLLEGNRDKAIFSSHKVSVPFL